MILRVPSLIITQSRKYAVKQLRRQPKKLKGAIIKQPKENNNDIDYTKQKLTIKTSEEYQEDPEGFGDLESDFMESHKSHKQFEMEAKQYGEQVKRWIIRNKYFNEKQPNLLTYAEKQQIKLLHTRDPEEWSAERLAESFPADPVVISKVLSARWSASSSERIRKHDELVMKNWSLFKQGKLPVAEHLKEHLQKFADRNFNDLKNNKIEASIPPPIPAPTTTEFASIITSCKGHKDKQNLIESGESEAINRAPSQGLRPAEQENETFLMGKVNDRRKMRLQDFKRHSKIPLINAPKILPPETSKRDDSISFNSTDVQEPAGSSENVKQKDNPFKKRPKIQFFENNEREDVLPPKTFSPPVKTPTPRDDETYFLEKVPDQSENPHEEGLPELVPENPSGTGILPRKEAYESTELEVTQEDMKKYEMSTVKEKIYIPRKLWRRGATYKVEDCYYDSDGEFLYRVPGMTGRSQ